MAFALTTGSVVAVPSGTAIAGVGGVCTAASGFGFGFSGTVTSFFGLPAGLIFTGAGLTGGAVVAVEIGGAAELAGFSGAGAIGLGTGTGRGASLTFEVAGAGGIDQSGGEAGEVEGGEGGAIPGVGGNGAGGKGACGGGLIGGAPTPIDTGDEGDQIGGAFPAKAGGGAGGVGGTAPGEAGKFPGGGGGGGAAGIPAGTLNAGTSTTPLQSGQETC